MLQSATEAKTIEIAIPLFQQLKSQSVSIFEDHFQTLIANQKDKEGVLNVIRIMQTDFGISHLSDKMIRNVVVPRLVGFMTGDELILLLQTTLECKAHIAIASVAYHYLSVYNWTEALNITNKYKISYHPVLFRNILVNAVIATNASKQYVQFMAAINDSVQQLQKLPSRSNAGYQQPSEVVGDILRETVKNLNEAHTDLLSDILKHMITEGLGISLRQKGLILNQLGSLGTKSIINMITTLPAKSVRRRLDKVKSISTTKQLTSNEIEIVMESSSHSRSSSQAMHSLLESYFNEGKTKKFLDEIKQLEEKDFQLKNGIYVKLLTVHSDDPSEMVKIYEQVKAKRPEFILYNPAILMRMVSWLVANDQVEKAVKMLETNPRGDFENEKSQHFKESQSRVWGVLKIAAEKGQAENVQQLFDAFIQGKHGVPTNYLLGALVQVHLVNNDYRRAVDIFENLVGQYHCTPYRQKLMCRIIEENLVEELQRVVDLTKQVYGDFKTLQYLSFSLILVGRKLEAKNILKTLDSYGPSYSITFEYEFRSGKGQIQFLEDIFEISDGLQNFNREEIYNYLASAYCKNDLPDKVIDLWKKRNEESLETSKQFASIVVPYLCNKNIEIPFDLPKDVTQAIQPKSSIETMPLEATIQNSDVQHKKQRDTSSKHNHHGKWLTVERLVQDGSLAEAATIAFNILMSGGNIYERIFNFLNGKLAQIGDIDSLTSFYPFLTEEQQTIFAIDNRLCIAYMSAGRGIEFIEILKNNIAKCTTDHEIEEVKRKFPLVSHCILKKQPEAVKECKCVTMFLPTVQLFFSNLHLILSEILIYHLDYDMAEQYAARDIISPFNVLWMHHFISGHDDEAAEIFNKHLINEPGLLNKYIILTAKERKDYQLIEKLLTVVNRSVISKKAKGAIYSALIDIYASCAMYDEAVNAIHRADAAVGRNNIYSHCLKSVRKGFEAMGKSVSY